MNFKNLLIVFVIFVQLQASEYTFKLLTGRALVEHADIAEYCGKQILQEFHGYPYLWQGTTEEALIFGSMLTSLAHSAVAVAYYHQKPVAFALGASFNEYDDIDFHGSIDLFKNSGQNPDEYYYIGQVIVEQEHRGKRLTLELFAIIESYACSQGYSKICLATESYDQHPLKPKNYQPLGNLWKKLGYQKSSIIYYSTWLTVQAEGPAKKQEHPLRYWIKNLPK